jgi:competence ComEA-like helix-hairpin-helix protein
MIARRCFWLIPAIACACTFAASAAETHEWQIMRNCQLVDNPANDGDSVHVLFDNKQYIFRLYFVDAPETGDVPASRLTEQAEYFGVTVPEVIEIGRHATAFTREKLSEPFTVLTRGASAMGRSRSERLYGFVETKDGDLGEQLVRNGLARVHGTKVVPPGLSGAREEEETLRQFEDAAKHEKIGGWGIAVDRLKVRAETVPKSFHFFDLSPTGQDEKPAPAKGKAAEPGKLDINTATAEQLESVPGIGAATAQRIIAARPFGSADDLRKVPGIGEKKYGVMRPYFQ